MKKFKISQIQFQAKSTPQENADILEKNYNKSLKFKPDLICTPECSNIITNDKIHLLGEISRKHVIKKFSKENMLNQYFKLIGQMSKEYFEKYSTPPTFDVLDQMTRLEVSSDMARTNIFDMLAEIRECDVEDHLWIQEKALKLANL